MIRAYSAALHAVGLLGRVAVAFVGFIVIVGVIVPLPSPGDRRGSDSRDLNPPAHTVVLKVPEGRPAGNLTIVDALGREIALLTHWTGGPTAVVTRYGGGPTVGYYHSAEGSVALLVTGSEVETQINLNPDGTMKSSLRKPTLLVSPRKPVDSNTPNGSELGRSKTMGSDGLHDDR
jgi:hypothetical protein